MAWRFAAAEDSDASGAATSRKACPPRLTDCVSLFLSVLRCFMVRAALGPHQYMLWMRSLACRKESAVCFHATLAAAGPP